jgi:glycosyltransferase involved in cell wall biosynthesis
VRPRILFIGGFPPSDSPIRGGIVTECRLLIESSFAARFELLLIDSTQRSIPEPAIFTRGVLAARRMARFVALVERQRPDAVLAFTSQGASFVEKCMCTAYARARGIPTVLLMRGGPFMDDVRDSAVYRWFARLLLRGASVVPCQGERWRQFFHEELGIEEARLPVIHNWTASEDYLSRERRAERSSGLLRVLFLAWVDRAKGVFDLVDASMPLWSDPATRGFELHIAGGGAHLDELRERVAAEGLADRITIHGWVGGDAKRALYESADVFVLPSYAEGMPNSMIEAMSLGVPVVVTPVGSIADVVHDGVNGVVVPVGDPGALRTALVPLLASAELRRRIGAAGRETARDVFGLPQGIDALSGALCDAMAAARARG